MMDLGLRDAAVLISGGTKGVGFSTALSFAREGAKVAITGRDQKVIDDTLAALRDAGSPDCFGIRCVLPDLSEIEKVFDAIEHHWGKLNVLINVAGPTDGSRFGKEFVDVSEDDWEYFIQMGIMSVVRCTRLAIPLMRKAEWGRIVIVSSQAARIATPTQTAYMTAKAALNAFSKNIGLGLAKENILVNSVTPGVIATEAMIEFMGLRGGSENGYDPTNLVSVADFIADNESPRARGAIGRAASSEEIVPAILLLGSKLNTYMVGSNIAIDGGTDYSTG
ncbi:SDR family NAD(P)-dependent oxidoreductase [Sphingobium phenoxybenzoativorans]|uniref:SDR family NAD(P)-dependent oxidoreductase n=1 Tax=Sphingobium phenoxybenzoativorans TaxID=1592790 RepID=UPI0009F424A7|nr:SDR family oxidoreductase [Sphingobium phenoxybenzoativorans]